MAKPLFFERFRARLSLLVILLVVPSFGLVLYSNLAQRRIEMKAIRDGARSLSELAAANQEDIIKSARQLLGTLTQFPFLVLNTNREFCAVHFSNLLKLSPDYVNFGLIETNGQLFCSGVTTNSSIALGDRSYFQQIIHGGKFAIGEFQVGRLTHVPSLNFAYPVRGEQGGCIRVVFSAIRISKLSEAVALIHLPPGARILVLDRRGHILVDQPRSPSAPGKDVSNEPVIRKILEGDERVFTMTGLEKTQSLHAVTPIGNGHSPSLFVCVSIPTSMSIAQANWDLFRNCSILSLVALLVLGGAWLYSQRFFLRPVGALVDAANALAAGNLEARSRAVEGAAELVQLGNAFNEMAESLASRHAELIKLNELLKTEIAERELAEVRIRAQTEEQKKLEEQLFRSQRMESIGALAGGIAHDLNNALVPVLMGSELLLQNDQDPVSRRSCSELISSSAKRCTELVKHILTFARGSKGQRGSIQLRHLIAEMAKIAKDTFPKSIAVRHDVAKDLWSVEGDSTELHQVLMNLCVNARDAMPVGGQLDVSAENVMLSAELAGAHPEAERGPYVVILVRDTGTGIEPGVLARIFEPFFTTKGPEKGTGLGLSTVANIIKRHNGFIEVQSKPGQGTEFKVFLPASQSAKPQADKPSERVLPTGHGELILVAEDEQSVLELVKTTLENYGYRVLTASNGLEAVACFEEHKDKIKLVLSDCDMPFLDGAGAVRAIKQIEPSIQIIITSGTKHPTEHLQEGTPSENVTLNKPYGMEQLLDGVAQALASARQ
jgi:signal transduction histidine kinase